MTAKIICSNFGGFRCRLPLTHGHAGHLPGDPMSIGAHANIRSPLMS